MVENTHKLSFGAELEFSDVDRSIDIPKGLGAWEGPKIAGYNLGSEIDIVNSKGIWRGIATDPLCLDCPVGGEIHVNPSWTIDSQLIRIMRIIGLFPQVGVACPNHGHIHVGIQGIWNDMEAVKNIFRYTRNQQYAVLEHCSGYKATDSVDIHQAKLADWVKEYLLVGDAKTAADELFERVEQANTTQEIRKALAEVECFNYEWVDKFVYPAPKSHRTSVNLYSLLRGETVEFRVFRASINPVEIYSSLLFSKRYIEEALRGEKGKSVEEILKEGQFRFAPLNFDEDLARGWQETRQSKGRSACLKKFAGVSEPTEDHILEAEEMTVFERALLDILKLCKMDFNGETIWHEL